MHRGKMLNWSWRFEEPGFEPPPTFWVVDDPPTSWAYRRAWTDLKAMTLAHSANIMYTLFETLNLLWALVPFRVCRFVVVLFIHHTQFTPLLYRSSCQVDANSPMCSAIHVSLRGWCRLGGPGEWNGLFTGEPVLLVQRSTDRIDSSAAQRTDLYITPPPPSSTSTQPATAGTALTRDKPHLPRAALILRLSSNRPPTVTADAHQCCQVAA